MNTHTPNEWHIHTVGCGVTSIYDANGKWIAYCQQGHGAMITAAPELADALRSMIRLIDDLHGDTLHSSTLEQARAVLAKLETTSQNTP